MHIHDRLPVMPTDDEKRSSVVRGRAGVSDNFGAAASPETGFPRWEERQRTLLHTCWSTDDEKRSSVVRGRAGVSDNFQAEPGPLSRNSFLHSGEGRAKNFAA